MNLRNLAALRREATLGPWTQSGTKAKPHWYVSSPVALVHPVPKERADYVDETITRWIADAAYIAAAGSLSADQLDALADVVEAAERVVRNGRTQIPAAAADELRLALNRLEPVA